MKILKSTRFQALVILAVIAYLSSLGFVSGEIFSMFTIVLGGHIGIRTVDRFAEKMGGKK